MFLIKYFKDTKLYKKNLKYFLVNLFNKKLK